MAATGTPTPNIGLRIPLGTDPASVDDINYNSNLIDTKLGAVGEDSVQDQIDDLNSKIESIKNTFTRFATTIPSSGYDVTKLSYVHVVQTNGTVLLEVWLKPGSYNGWVNDVSISGLPQQYRPFDVVYGGYRISASADAQLNVFGILHPEGAVQFFVSGTNVGDLRFTFTYPYNYEL